MFSSSIRGLDDLQRHLREATEALQGLDGEIAQLKINPSDPDAEEKAVGEMRAAVDAKVAPYRGNSIVDALAEKSKEAFEDAIRKRVREARSEA